MKANRVSFSRQIKGKINDASVWYFLFALNSIGLMQCKNIQNQKGQLHRGVLTSNFFWKFFHQSAKTPAVKCTWGFCTHVYTKTPHTFYDWPFCTHMCGKTPAVFNRWPFCPHVRIFTSIKLWYFSFCTLVYTSKCKKPTYLMQVVFLYPRVCKNPSCKMYVGFLHSRVFVKKYFFKFYLINLIKN